MTNAAISVRSAEPSDGAAIVAFNDAMARESEGKSLHRATLEEGVRRALSDSAACRYFVAECDGRLVGQTMVTFEWSDWRCGWFWWIQSVYVEPTFRRRGVFRALHAHVRALAGSRADVCGIRLYVHRHNHGALETYRKLGLVLTDYYLCEEDWSSSRGGVPIDAHQA
ncbi:MAG: GNAT family N-acetyltransferase [Planctomycetes bacterium]|nr:GNAT family N-acetyltransferase [Planctomycetota bacterium]